MPCHKHSEVMTRLTKSSSTQGASREVIDMFKNYMIQTRKVKSNEGKK